MPGWRANDQPLDPFPAAFVASLPGTSCSSGVLASGLPLGMLTLRVFLSLRRADCRVAERARGQRNVSCHQELPLECHPGLLANAAAQVKEQNQYSVSP